MNAEKRLAQSLGVDIRFEKIKIGDYLINYVTAGHGDPVLLIHGANIGWGQWHLNIPALAKYFQVYGLDLPGSGGSTRIDFYKADIKKEFLNVVDQFIKLKGFKRIHIIGHSIGGWIALKLVLQERKYIDKIVLVNPIGFTNFIPLNQRLMSIYFLAKLLTKTVIRSTRKNMRRFLSSVLYNPSALREEFVDYFYESVRKSKFSHPLLFISSLSNLFRMDSELVLLDSLSHVDRPTLIIVGEKDPLMPLVKSFEAFKLIPGARIEIFFNAGHVPSIEKSKEFNELVTNFLIS